jgi:hypothetical protein
MRLIELRSASNIFTQRSPDRCHASGNQRGGRRILAMSPSPRKPVAVAADTRRAARSRGPAGGAEICARSWTTQVRRPWASRRQVLDHRKFRIVTHHQRHDGAVSPFLSTNLISNLSGRSSLPSSQCSIDDRSFEALRPHFLT